MMHWWHGSNDKRTGPEEARRLDFEGVADVPYVHCPGSSSRCGPDEICLLQPVRAQRRGGGGLVKTKPEANRRGVRLGRPSTRPSAMEISVTKASGTGL